MKDIRIKEIIEKAKDLDWTVTEISNGDYELGKYSPAGQDFNINITGEDADKLLESIYEAYENYDPSYEAYIWLDDEGHGMNGAPHDMGDLYNDMVACEEMILDLYNSIKYY